MIQNFINCTFSSCLEQDLLLVMTHYIEKDQMQRNVHAIKRPTSGRRTLAKPQVFGFHMLLLWN